MGRPLARLAFYLSCRNILTVEWLSPLNRGSLDNQDAVQRKWFTNVNNIFLKAADLFPGHKKTLANQNSGVTRDLLFECL